jgi:hypothetical protein
MFGTRSAHSALAVALLLALEPRAAAQTRPAPPPPASSAVRPVVEVRGPRGALESRAKPASGPGHEDDDDEGWREVCPLPCRAALDPALEYRIAGGAPSTDVFRLPPNRPNLYLDVDAGSRGARVAGIVFIPVGATVLTGGLLVGLIGGAFEQDQTAIGGFFAAGLGAAMMTAGIVLVRVNRTSVRAVTPGEPALRLASGLALTARGLAF